MKGAGLGPPRRPGEAIATVASKTVTSARAMEVCKAKIEGRRLK